SSETSTQDVNLDTRFAQVQSQTPNDGGPVAPGQTQQTVYEGEATFYDLRGFKTASGERFDPTAMKGAMTAEKVPLDTKVTVDYTHYAANGPVKTRIHVTINDRGPFAVGPDGRALRPLHPHPMRVIDLTPRAFRLLTGSTKAGHVPVRVILP